MTTMFSMVGRDDTAQNHDGHRLLNLLAGLAGAEGQRHETNSGDERDHENWT
jgi:hypothetical protein